MEKFQDGFVERGEGGDGHNFFIVMEGKRTLKLTIVDKPHKLDAKSVDLYLTLEQVVKAAFEKYHSLGLERMGIQLRPSSKE